MKWVIYSMSQYQMDPTNDYYLAQFYRAVLDYVNETNILTNYGSSILLMDVENEMETLIMQPNHQRTLVKVTLYETIIFNLAKLFLVVISTIEDGGRFNQPLSAHLQSFILTLKPRTVLLMNHTNAALQGLTEATYDEFLQRYNKKKDQLFQDNVF